MTPTHCPSCPSRAFKKNGQDKKGRQRFACNKCQCVWTAETWKKQHTKGARILQAIKAVDAGATIKDAAAMAGFSRETVRKYLVALAGYDPKERAKKEKKTGAAS